MATHIMQQVMESAKADTPDVPDKVWKDFGQTVKPTDFVDRLVPIDDKYFTHEDIKGLIQFYQSPLGHKLLSVQPKVMQESAEVGDDWGAQLEDKLDKTLQRSRR